MPCDKDFGYVTLTRGLTWERYGDLWQLTCATMPETTPKDHLIILHEFLAGNNAHAMNSSIRAWVNRSRVQVNCSRASVKLHLSCIILYERHMYMLTIPTQYKQTSFIIVKICLWDQHTLHSYIVSSQYKAQLLKTMFVIASVAYSVTSLSINL